MRKFPCDYNYTETSGFDCPAYSKSSGKQKINGTVFQSLVCGKTLNLNYSYYRFFIGIQFSKSPMNVLALNG